MATEKVSQNRPDAESPPIPVRQRSVTLESNRERIAEMLSAQLASGGGSGKRHQNRAVACLRDFLLGGEVSGYISHATGTGKTYIIADIINATKGVKTVVLSPTKLSLSQTGGVVERLAPDAELINYYSEEKGDLSASIINTTYHSFMNMLAGGKIRPEEIGMVIADESHMALGEQRHTIFRAVPNAVKLGLTATPYFAPLDGYMNRKMVDENEPWVGMFTNCIDDFGLDEAIDAGILRPVEAFMVKTGVSVGMIGIKQGEYDRNELARWLDREQRNSLAIAAIVGPEALREGATPEQAAALKELHDKIKDRKIVVFGLSVPHIEKLAQTLNANGVAAAAVHHGIGKEERERILEGHASGRIRVLLSVEILKQSWDSPTTSVAIMLKPTYSGISAIQRLGRVLRAHESAEFAIAVDFVDDFRKNKPVLVPNLFDPYYVLRGSMNGQEPGNREGGGSSKKPERPNIVLSGMDAKIMVEEARIEYELQGKFSKASVLELIKDFDDLVANLYRKNSGATPIEIYQTIADSVPERVGASSYEKILAALAGIDSNAAKKAADVMIYMSLKHVLRLVEEQGPRNQQEKEDMVQAAILEIYQNLNKINSNFSVPSQLIRFGTKAVCELIADRDQIPARWVRNGAYQAVMDFASERAAKQEKVGYGRISSEAARISQLSGTNDTKSIADYLAAKLGGLAPKERADPWTWMRKTTARIDMEEALLMLPSRNRRAFVMWHAEEGERKITYEELAQETGLSEFRLIPILRRTPWKLRTLLTEDKAKQGGAHMTGVSHQMAEFERALKELNFERAERCARWAGAAQWERHMMLRNVYSHFIETHNPEGAAVLAQNTALGREKEVAAALTAYYMSLRCFHFGEAARIERNHRLRLVEDRRQAAAREACVHILQRGDLSDAYCTIAQAAGLDGYEELPGILERYNKNLGKHPLQALRIAKRGRLGKELEEEAATRAYWSLRRQGRFKEAVKMARKMGKMELVTDAAINE
jgi:superfamily II DNA or RNA helicase/DNA-directed RNA polymerase specialized sigma24 family protein